MANKVIKDKCKNWCSECKAFDWAHCTEKYEVEKPIENVICKDCGEVITVEQINNHSFMKIKGGGLIHWNCK